MPYICGVLSRWRQVVKGPGTPRIMARNTQDHVHGQEHPGSWSAAPRTLDMARNTWEHGQEHLGSRSEVPGHGQGQEHLGSWPGTPRIMSMARNTQDLGCSCPWPWPGTPRSWSGTPRTMAMARNLETNCTQESHLVVKTRLFSILVNRLKKTPWFRF